MRRLRAISLLMAFILSFVTIQGSFLEANASGLEKSYSNVQSADTAEGDFVDNLKVSTEAEDNGDDLGADIEDLWNRLIELANDKNEITYDEGSISKVLIYEDEEENVVFSAENENEVIKLVLTESKEQCHIFYSSANSLLEYDQDIEKVASDKSENENISKERATAEKILLTAMELWEDSLNQAGISLGELGFKNWEEYLNARAMEEKLDDGSKISDNAELAGDIEDNSDTDIIEENDGQTESSDEAVETKDDVTEEDADIVAGSEISDEEAVTDEESVISEETLEEDSTSEDLTDDVISEEEADSAMPVINDVERIELNYTSVNLKPGESIQLNAKYYPENANVSVVWSVGSYSSYISIDNKGMLKAIKPYAGSGIPVSVKVGTKYATIRVYVDAVDNDIDMVDEDGSSVVAVVSGVKIVVADGIWVGNFKNVLYYTGSPVTQDLNVYCEGKKLTINKDYSLTYRNNINACSGNLTKSPSVTVTMKGQYSGKKTLYYTIERAIIGGADNTTDNISIAGNGKVQKYVPTLMFNGKKLINNKDFTMNYAVSDPVSGKIDYWAVGIGNMSGMKYGCYYIVDKNKSLSNASVTMKTSYAYEGGTPSDSVVAGMLDIKVKFPGDNTIYNPITDTANFSYSINYAPGYVGTATIVITAKDTGAFRGTVKRNFKVTASYKLASVAQVNSNFKSEVIFYKNELLNRQRDNVGLELISNHSALIPGTDYKVSYTGINRVGTATVTYTGIGAYTGVIKKTYKIVNDNPVLYVDTNDIDFIQGGVFDAIKGVYCPKDDWDDLPLYEQLIKNVDYTVTYTNNKATGIAGYVVKGKGNYAKATPVTGTFNIRNADISKCSITIPDKAYSSKKGAFKSVPIITATNGKRLVAGKDYDKTIEYIYDDWDDPTSQCYDCPAAGSIVNVKVTGIGAYAGSVITGCYCVYDSKTNGMNKLFISIDDKTYTGNPVELNIAQDVHIFPSAKDMKAKTNEMTPASDYVRIISYKNNTNSGNATVTLGANYKMTNVYGGTKNVVYKILKKNYSIPKAVTGIALDKTTCELHSVTSMAYGTLTATVYPSYAVNNNIEWKSSNTKAVTINPAGNICYFYAAGAGTSVITATTQDGSKVAKCTVTSYYKPLQSISLPAQIDLYMNDIRDLNYTCVPADGYIGSGAVWSVDDSLIATVNNNGQVKGISKGETFVHCTVMGKTAKCKVVVDGPKPIEQINLSSGLLTMKVNETQNLTYNILPSDAYTTTPVWSSSDSTVATVDSNGKVKAVALGEAVITMQSYNKTAKCLVKVRQDSFPLAFNVTDSSEYTNYKKGPAIPNDGKEDRYSIKYAAEQIRETGMYTAIYIPSGVYDLFSTEWEGLEFIGLHNTTIYMEPDTILKISSTYGNAQGFFVEKCENVTFVGGVIDGSISNKDFNEAELSTNYGFSISASSNITLDGVTIRNLPGCGIELTGNRGVTIKNCLIENCKDAGISLCSNYDPNNIVIQNSIIRGNGGYSYGGYGIIMAERFFRDVDWDVDIKNVTISDVIFENNSKADFYSTRYNKKNKTNIDNINFVRCSFGGEINITNGTNINFTNTQRKPKKYYNAVTKSNVFPDN